ncbi:BTAD domain-containing putative transcriptional regulator [Streptomyces sp. Z26]|uniref:AfsR/SARP family transcriptional regulator n=1 Tax=Streptomyces sp. Z26 TaxID=2500177 RepID=UPI001F0BCB0B|nr:BTAD domain-containing putative transcriptional regulator [Streptomyces sp. Z26]
MRYRFSVLGTTQAIRTDGTTVPLGGARLRALLTALAVADGGTVGTGALVASVWGPGEDPPGDAPAALQALVGRLRRALGREAVASGTGGYRLVADRDDIDLFRFERLAAEGARALADGDPHKAAERLDAALALWRGPVCADLPDGGDATGVRARARHLAARRDRLAAECALGRAEEALPALRELAAAHPLDEPLHALRLRALRDAGRPAEALAAYEEVRAVLADRLGTDPGAELRSLHAELLRPGDGPDEPRSPRTPDATRTPDAHPATRPRTPAPARTAPAPARTPAAGNLRSRLTSFVGRETDLDALRADLDGARLVTLLGPGGAGKTRLSQEAAESVADHWPDGVWLAELAPVRDPDTVAETVLTALGGRETVLRGSPAEGLRAAVDPHASDPLGQLAERCASRRMLLVLDNCEHVIDAAATLAETLLLECPQVTVLATSREPLGVPGECVRPVEPLPAPVALRLLADRGAAAQPGFRIEADPEACAEICRRLDGLPLAIELAAARLRSLTPRQLADRLDDRFRLLTGGSRTVLPRQQALRAVVDWSWDLLDAAEHAVLRRLSVFSGGCRLDQAEAVCADGGVGGTADPPAPVAPAVLPRDVAALLGALVDKSLVVAAPSGPDGMHYRLLETVAEYAAERLDEAAERAAVERRHLVTYRELARTGDPLLRGPAQREWLERLEDDHDNLRTALRRAVAARDEHEALCLVLSLYWFWELRGHSSDAVTWTKAASDLGPDPFGTPGVRAPSLAERCTVAPPPMAPEMLAEARRQVWIIHFAAAQPPAAWTDTDEGRARLRALADAYRPGQPQVCRPPASAWFFAMLLLGDPVDLGEVLDAGVRGCRDTGSDWELAMMLHMRCRMLNELPGTFDRSVRDAEESLALFTRLGDRWGVAEALAVRGEAYERRGRLAEAAGDYRRAAGVARELGAEAQVPVLRARLAMVLVEGGDDSVPEEGEDGERMLREAIGMSEGLGGDTVHFPRVGLVLMLGREGRIDEARAELAALRDSCEQWVPSFFRDMIEGIDGYLDVRAGEPRAGLDKLCRALAGSRSDPLTRIVAPQLIVWWLATVAEAVSGLGRPEAAARLLGAYDTRRADHGHVPVSPRECAERAGRAARAALGDTAYARLHAEGGRLGADEATALACAAHDPERGAGRTA